MTRKRNRSKRSQQNHSQHASSRIISAPEQSNVDHEGPACAEYFDASDSFDPSEIQETLVDAETGAEKKGKFLGKMSQENNGQCALSSVISAPEESGAKKKGKFLSKKSQENNYWDALSSVISAPEQSKADDECSVCTEYFDASEYFGSFEIQEPRVEAETSGKMKEIICGKLPQKNNSQHTSSRVISAPQQSNSNVEVLLCPLCPDYFDPSEIKEPLCRKCGFNICAFCYNRIKNGDGNGRCPQCRTPYPKDS